jgi:membrane associated rhomboid family serine protease
MDYSLWDVWLGAVGGFFVGFFFASLLTMNRDERRKNNYIDFRRRNALDKEDVE